MALALPKLRWLLLGAIAAGAWVVHEDMKVPRPPERIKPQAARQEPRPSPPAAVGRKSAEAAAQKPVPPRPLAAKSAQPAPKQAQRQKASEPPRPSANVAPRTALALPPSVSRPPAKPQTITTGSVARDDASTQAATRQRKPSYVQTTAQVRLRAQASTSAEVIATLAPRTVMRELARSGKWRLVTGEGRKGWIHSDYLGAATYLARRPKQPVAEVSQAAPARKP